MILAVIALCRQKGTMSDQRSGSVCFLDVKLKTTKQKREA